MFKTSDEVIYWIENINRKEKRKDLSRIKAIMESLDNPQNSYKIIHIAGTNGKGSTACFIKEMLKNLGYKVGFFTSPYILKFNERIMINDEFISDDDLVNYGNYLYKIIKEYEALNDDVVPFFEVLTILGLYYFKEKKVDFAVVECGLGGRLDATNFVVPVISVITSVGLDHENSIGPTIEDIAYHKAGIIKENSLCLMYEKDDINSIFFNEAKAKKAKLLYVSNPVQIKLKEKTYFSFENVNYSTNLLGIHQAYNASLAIKVLESLVKIDYSLIDRSLNNIFWPGRYEVIRNYILDGAHNIPATRALVETLKEANVKNLTCIFTALKDKNYKEVIAILDEVVDKYLFTTISDRRSVLPEVFLDCTNKESKIIDLDTFDFEANLEKTLITGSLHFVSYVRNLIK